MKYIRFACNKLVRDKSVERMKERGVESKGKILTDKLEYIQALKEKLLEETQEIIEAPTRDNFLNECADVLEVVEAWVEALGSTMEEVESRQKERRQARGGFKGRVYVEWFEIPKESEECIIYQNQSEKYPIITPE